MDIRSNISPSEYAANLEVRQRAEHEKRIREAERDAQQRVQHARQQADEVALEVERRSDQIRADGDARISAERELVQEQLEQLKKSGYEQIRDIKRRQEAEVARTREEGEHLQGELDEYYRNQVSEVTKVSSKAVRDAYMQNLRNFETQDKAARVQRDTLQAQSHAEMDSLRKRHEDQRSTEVEKATAEQAQLRGKLEENRAKSEKEFTTRYSQTLNGHQAMMDRMNAEAGQKLNELREDGARKLSLYEQRQEDPFYRMVNLDAELFETDEAFVLTARVPEYEQANIKAVVQGNQIVVSGTRRSEDSQKLEEGRSRSTATFQNFRETFPLDWPVAAGAMLREADGDTLTFTFPKRAGMIDPESGNKKSIEHPLYSRTRAPRPDFPEDLIAPAAPRSDKPIS